MKFSLKKLLVGAVLAGTMTVFAGAANFDSAAQSLSDLGLMTGTQSGFDLDRASTRGEAAAMLVRLLGKEEEAEAQWKSDEAGFAFTDMEDAAWAKPYVNWLVKNGLAAGTTETTFAPRDNCSAQMAATFLLRALGYSDAAGGDFTYFTAMDFAREKGVVDAVNCDEKNFQRDHLAAMCYTALSLPPKSGGDDLLSSLVASGAVADNDASKAVRQRFADYRDYAAASASAAKETSMAMKVTADVAVTVEGDAVQVKMVQDAAVKADPAKPAEIEMAMTGSVDVSLAGTTEKQESAMYVKNGVAYVEAAGEKMQMPMDFAAALEQAQLVNIEGVSGEPITAIESIKKSAAGGKTTYEVAYNAALMNGLIDSVLGSVMETLPDVTDDSVSMTLDKIVIRETLDTAGKLESMGIDMAMKMTEMGMNMAMDMKMEMQITATGDAVKVAFPDYVK